MQRSRVRSRLIGGAVLSVGLTLSLTGPLAVVAAAAPTATQPDRTPDDHPSGRDRSVEPGGSTVQGRSTSDPDGMDNGGADKPGGAGGFDADKDGNNGCGNDDDFEDDNRGNCGGPRKHARHHRRGTPAATAQPVPVAVGPADHAADGAADGAVAGAAPAGEGAAVAPGEVEAAAAVPPAPAPAPPQPGDDGTISLGGADVLAASLSRPATGPLAGAARSGLAGVLALTGIGLLGALVAAGVALAGGGALRAAAGPPEPAAS